MMAKCVHCGFEIATTMHNCCQTAEDKKKEQRKQLLECRELLDKALVEAGHSISQKLRGQMADMIMQICPVEVKEN